MKILAQFNFFWQKHPEFAFTPLEMAVYAYLLNICNSLGGKNPFNLSKERLLFEMQLKTEKPLDTARLRLREAGLLDFEKGNGRGKTTLYTLTPAPAERGELNSPLSETTTTPKIKKSPPERAPKRGQSNTTLSGTLSGGVSAKRAPERGQFDNPDKGGTTPDKNRIPVVRKTSLRKSAKEAAKKGVPFETFWDAYEKKIGRKAALKKWGDLTPDEQTAILAHVPRYVAATPDKQFRKDAATYLFNRTWEDEELPPPRHGQPPASTTTEPAPVLAPPTAHDELFGLTRSAADGLAASRNTPEYREYLARQQAASQPAPAA